jgi:hypothetical protein
MTGKYATVFSSFAPMLDYYDRNPTYKPYVPYRWNKYGEVGMPSDVYEKAVQYSALALRFIPKVHMTDKILNDALKKYGGRIIIKYRPTINRNIMIKCLMSCGQALYYVPVEKRDLELCKIACAQDIRALEFVPTELLTEEMCKDLIDKFPLSIKLIAETPFVKSFYKIAVLNNPYALQYIPAKHHTLKLCKLAMMLDPNVFKHVTIQTDELIKMAINHNSDNFTFVTKSTPELVKFAIDNGRYNADMFAGQPQLILSDKKEDDFDLGSDDESCYTSDEDDGDDESDAKSKGSVKKVKKINKNNDVTYHIDLNDKFKVMDYPTMDKKIHFKVLPDMYRTMINCGSCDIDSVNYFSPLVAMTYKNPAYKHMPNGTRIQKDCSSTYFRPSADPTYEEMLIMAQTKKLSIKHTHKEAMRRLGPAKLINVLKLHIKKKPSEFDQNSPVFISAGK